MHLIVLLALIVSFNFEPSIGQTIHEIEYLTYRVVSEYEIINKNNGSEPECRLEYDGINNDHYITPEERHKECENIWGNTVINDLTCFKDNWMENSCAIKCFSSEDKDGCGAVVDKVRKLRFIDKQCGPKHYCNELGCCEKREVSSPPTTVTTVTPITKQTKATTIGSTERTTVTQSTTSSDQFSCPYVGNFADERDQSSYWHCYYAVEEILECDENEIFDKWNEKCVFDWSQLITCDKEGYFKNPYDCHKFYWCYEDKSTHKMVVNFYTCADDVNGEPLVWDEEKVSCVSNQNDTIRCDDRPLPPDKSTKDLPNDSLLETDEEFRLLYENNIECQTIGRFRNPFDCHKYYRCYYEKETDIFLEIEFYKCKDELMVFDDQTGHCVEHTDTSLCHNKQIPGASNQSYDSWIRKKT